MAAGSQGQTLAINGSGFVSSSTVTYNGAGHAASYLGPTEMALILSTTDVANTGTYAVVVSNPTPGGGISSPANFTVVTGTPTGVFPVTVTASSGSLTHTTTFNLVVQ